MDLLTEILKHPFTWGLLLGLLIAGFIWKSGFSARRHLARELKRVEAELKNLQGHLNTQLKITATGHESLQSELASLKQQNENLRVNHAALQQKPGRAEQRLLQIQEIAIRTMREQAPAGWKGDQAREAQVLNALFPLVDRNRKATQALFDLIKHQPGYK